MTTTIYYYSGTGNSFAIARAIAQGLGEAEVVSLARCREGAAPASPRVGIVFPILAWGPPRTVHEFIANLDLKGARYVFAVASCGGTAAGALPRLRKALRARGADLHAGFIVRSPSYMVSTGGEAPMIAMVRRLSGRPFGTSEERLPGIIEAIRKETPSRPERNALAGAVLGNFFHAMARGQFAKIDSGYSVNESCAGCGNCSRICPRGNVRLEGGRPAWHHDCDFCGACAAWCAHRAIGLQGAPSLPRGRNPQVTAQDLMSA